MHTCFLTFLPIFDAAPKLLLADCPRAKWLRGTLVRSWHFTDISAQAEHVSF